MWGTSGLRSLGTGEAWGRRPYQKWGVLAGTHVPLPTFEQVETSVSLEHEDICVITYRQFLDHLLSLLQALFQVLLPPKIFPDILYLVVQGLWLSVSCLPPKCLHPNS